MEGSGNLYALLTMWMVFPNQAAGLQGLLCVNRDFLAVNDLGIGSGWQQSRQNWMPAAVVGQRIRMESSGLYNVEAAPLHSFLLSLASLGPPETCRGTLRRLYKGSTPVRFPCLALRCFHALKISIGKWNLFVVSRGQKMR